MKRECFIRLISWTLEKAGAKKTALSIRRNGQIRLEDAACEKDVDDMYAIHEVAFRKPQSANDMALLNIRTSAYIKSRRRAKIIKNEQYEDEYQCELKKSEDAAALEVARLKAQLKLLS